MRFFLTFFLFCFLTISGYCQKISYRLSMPEPHTHYFLVDMTIKDPGMEEVELSMPVWTPGSYKIRDFSKNIESIHAFQGNHEIPIVKSNKNTWTINTLKNSELRISYKVYAFEMSVRTSFLDISHGYINGASVFLFMKNHINRPLILEIISNSEWDKISTGLTRLDDRKFKAESYDELVDAPREIGNHAV